MRQNASPNLMYEGCQQTTTIVLNERCIW